MGWYNYVSDLANAVTIQSADAEAANEGPAVSGGASTKTPASGTDEESGEEAEANEKDAVKSDGGDNDAEEASGKSSDDKDKEEGGEDEEDEEEDEEEEDDEPVDVKEKLEEECMKTAQCAPAKHHFDECAERVQQQQEENDGHAKEDCVEEFFHLMHCASSCAAPKLFRQLR